MRRGSVVPRRGSSEIGRRLAGRVGQVSPAVCDHTLQPGMDVRVVQERLYRHVLGNGSMLLTGRRGRIREVCQDNPSFVVVELLEGIPEPARMWAGSLEPIPASDEG